MASDPEKVWNGKSLTDFPHLGLDKLDEATLLRYELDIDAGRLKADTPEEHARAMEALAALTKAMETKRALAAMKNWDAEFDDIGRDAPTKAELEARKAATAPAQPQQATAPAHIVNKPTPRQLEALAALKNRPPNVRKPVDEPPVWFSELMDRFETIKQREDRTNKSYRAAVEEFEAFAGKPLIWEVNEDHVSGWQVELASKTDNKSRTVDKKVDVLKALFNFGKKQRYFSGENPFADRYLVEKKEKKHGGWKIWALDEVKEVMGCPEFGELAGTNPSLHLFMGAAVVSGIRATALASLQPHNMRRTISGVPYVQVTKDKTAAGVRDVPVPEALWNRMQAHLSKHGGFGYKLRDDGGGASDPVRKDLAEHLGRIGATKRGFTVHGLRKTLNTALQKAGVSLEDRCQLLGHDIDHVNVNSYTPGQVPLRTIEELGQIVAPTQEKLMSLIAWGV